MVDNIKPEHYRKGEKSKERTEFDNTIDILEELA